MCSDRAKKRAGFVIPLAMLAAMCFAFFLYTVSSMSRGYRSQVLHMNNQQLAFQIATSGFARIQACSQCGQVYGFGQPHTCP